MLKKAFPNGEGFLLFHLHDPAVDLVVFDGDQAVGGAGCAGIEHPHAVLQTAAVGDVGVTKEEQVAPGLMSLGDGALQTALDAPKVAVAEQHLLARQGDILGGGIIAPSVAVAPYDTEGDLGEGVRHVLGVLNQIAQMDDLVGGVELDGVIHPGPGAVGVGKDKDFQSGHLTPFSSIYWDKPEIWEGIAMQDRGNAGMAELMKNREAIAKLAASSDARQLIRMLEGMGGMRQAAQAAAGGDAGALAAMVEGLMRTEEGARLAQSIGEQAKQAGLE